MERQRTKRDQISSPWEQQRRIALFQGLDVVERNTPPLTIVEAELLKTSLLNGYIAGETVRIVEQRLSTDRIINTLYNGKRCQKRR